MDNGKTGELIRQLRKERNLTQKELANRLHVSDRTISKWERGCGYPDISLLRELSETLEIDIDKILMGDLNPNEIDRGNMKRIRFYRCTSCGNILTSTSEADISCCGRKIEPLESQGVQKEHRATIKEVEDEYFVSIDHPMRKDCYISFVACVNDERVVLVRMYPEQSAQARFPHISRAKWFAACTELGLFELK